MGKKFEKYFMVLILEKIFYGKNFGKKIMKKNFKKIFYGTIF